MRVLGVDFGESRMGLAVSDPTMFLAGGIGTFEVSGIKNAVDIAGNKARELDVKTVVIGYPVNMNGSVGPRAERSEKFAQLLREKFGLETELVDERRTTILAADYMDMTGTFGKKRKAAVDTLSAQIILQTYLDRLKNKE